MDIGLDLVIYEGIVRNKYKARNNLKKQFFHKKIYFFPPGVLQQMQRFQ